MMRLSFNSSLQQALDLLSVLNEVVDMDEAHRINASQLINLEVMCLENCRQRVTDWASLSSFRSQLTHVVGFFY